MMNMLSKYDNMHNSAMNYALKCMNNHVIGSINFVLSTIIVETPSIDSGCCSEKEFTELICMNP